MLSRELVRLNRDLPLEIDWSRARVGGVDHPQVETLCREFGFRRLADRVRSLQVESAPAVWSGALRTRTCPARQASGWRNDLSGSGTSDEQISS